MKNTESFIPDLKELGLLMLGFLPWMLFLFLSGNTMSSLEIAIVISLVASVTLGFGDLKRGFILSWGTTIFFLICLILVDFLNNVWMAREMDLVSNVALSTIMWFTILIGKPFALQYAKRGMPKEKWNDEHFIRGCRYITVVWAFLMTFAVLISILKRTTWLPFPNWVYFDLTLLNIVVGLTFTTIFKRKKRLQRELANTNSIAT
jgi:carotenoid cleavage dioxygenase